MPVTTTFLEELQQLVSLHGYWVIGLIVGLESLGLPLPGETILVLAAIYAATEPSFNIWGREARPREPKTATVERREASVPRHGTQGASLGAWRAALRARPRVFR